MLNIIDEYLKILDHDRKNEAAYVKLANIYLRQNIITAGISTLEQALKNGIENRAVIEILAQLYLKNGECEKAIEIINEETKNGSRTGYGRLLRRDHQDH